MTFIKNFKHSYYQKFKKSGFDFNNPVHTSSRLTNVIVNSYDFVNQQTEEYITIQEHSEFNNPNFLLKDYYLAIGFDNDITIEYKQKRFITILRDCLGLHTQSIECVINSLIEHFCTLGIFHKNKDYKDFSVNQLFNLEDKNFNIHDKHEIVIKNIVLNTVLNSMKIPQKNFNNIALKDFAITVNIDFHVKSVDSKYTLVPYTTFCFPLLDDYCFLTLMEDTHKTKNPIIKYNQIYYLINEQKDIKNLIESLIQKSFECYFKYQEIDLHSITNSQMDQFIEINNMLDY